MSELINNRQKKIETLKSVITGLHQGDDPEVVKARLKDVVREVSGDEIVAMEQQLMDEGMEVSEVKAMCDLHSQVLRELIAEPGPTQRPAGHPVEVFLAENRALAERVAALRDSVTAVLTPALATLPVEVLEAWRAQVEELLELEKHYARKENLLFPRLEARGVTGPSQVMWAKDDDVREALKALREALAEDQAAIEEWRVVAEQVAVPLADQIEEMFTKEERFLLPMAEQKLTEAEWREIASEGERFGYCLIDPPPPFSDEERADSDQVDGAQVTGQVTFSAGALSPAQLRGIMGALPLDITFVDADDRVAFFSEGDRIFPRPKAVIGRKVQFCHPPKSVDVVERILADFKAGRQDSAAFWIQLHGRFVHIRYFAVREAGGDYLGTVEMSQDLTPLRALEGDRRLLEYDDEKEVSA